MKKIKNILTKIHPTVIETREGSVTPYLEITKTNGKYVLNSDTANYSFGGLHVLFDTFFKQIHIKQYDIHTVLLLGMGAGSVITLLKGKYKIDCAITAIEKDDVVIELAKKYFQIEKHKSLSIVNDDAFEYVKTTYKKFDLIISDIFIEGNVPEQFASPEYIHNLKRILNKNSCIIYNKMTENPKHKKEVKAFEKLFSDVFIGAETHKLIANDSENSLLYYNTLLLK
jgi:precorrin-6B methylase 2